MPSGRTDVSIENKHTMELVYTNNDDGVWLECRACPEAINLGFSATAKQAMRAQQSHQEHVEGFLTHAKDVALEYGDITTYERLKGE